MSLLHLNFMSKYLRGNTDVNIILPDLPEGESPEVFYQPGKKYPVLWLLHGGMGDYSDWVRKTNIELYATENQLMVIMPSALNSSYCDWPNFGGGYMAHEYLIHELMPMIYAWYPASNRREDNFLAGLSMGGHGTWKLALTYPEKYAACASLSGAAPDFRKRYEAETAQGRRTHISDLVQIHGGIDGLLKSRENTRGTAEKLAAAGRQKALPRLFAAVGGDDPHAGGVLESVAFMQELGIDVTFREIPGYAHEWRFWDLGIQEALRFFGFQC